MLLMVQNISRSIIRPKKQSAYRHFIFTKCMKMAKYIVPPLYSTKTLPFLLPFPLKYLCFTKYVNKVIQKHKVGQENLMEISKFPALNNDGGYLALSSSEKPQKGHTFDTCRFRDEMHTTNTEKTTGISLEKKSPELPLTQRKLAFIQKYNRRNSRNKEFIKDSLCQHLSKTKNPIKKS